MQILAWLLPALWAVGFALVLAVRLSRSLSCALLLKNAQSLDMTLDEAVTVKASSSLQEAKDWSASLIRWCCCPKACWRACRRKKPKASWRMN